MAAHSNADLRGAFVRWATVYGEPAPKLSASMIENIGHALRTPAANDDDAAQIERIVRSMEASGRWKEARVLRAQYSLPHISEALRIRALKRRGLDISRTAYYVYLDAAHAYVSGALSMRKDQGSR